MALPRHPGNDDDTPAPSTRTRGALLVALGVVALILIMVALHLTGFLGGH